jgi:hypothetical protein
MLIPAEELAAVWRSDNWHKGDSDPPSDPLR